MSLQQYALIFAVKCHVLQLQIRFQISFEITNRLKSIKTFHVGFEQAIVVNTSLPGKKGRLDELPFTGSDNGPGCLLNESEFLAVNPAKDVLT